MPGLHQRGLITTSAFLVITPDAETGEDRVAIIDSGWRLYHHRRIIEYLGRLGYEPGPFASSFPPITTRTMLAAWPA